MAWNASLALLPAATRATVLRQEELRQNVVSFAERLKGTADRGEQDQEVFNFPANLTAKERRLVHEAAEQMGLHSFSTSGPDGTRFVSISCVAAGQMSAECSSSVPAPACEQVSVA